MVYVNVDVVFLVNFVTDLAWLWATSHLAGVWARRWRIVAAAGFGALAAVFAYFPAGRWLTSVPGVILGTAALLLVAYWPCKVPQAIRAVGYFLFSGGILAGVTLLAGMRHGDPAQAAQTGTGPVPSGLVAAGLLVSFIGARYLWQAARERQGLVRGLYGLRVQVGGRTVELTAFLDTGNGLKEPLSGAPVAVVEADCLAGLLPDAVMDALAWGWDALERLPPRWAVRCRLVPYRAVGKPAGVLVAVVPDELWIRAPGDSPWQQVKGLVGLASEPLHAERTYRALLPPGLAEQAFERPGIA